MSACRRPIVEVVITITADHVVLTKLEAASQLARKASLVTVSRSSGFASLTQKHNAVSQCAVTQQESRKKFDVNNYVALRLPMCPSRERVT
jgi:hypothetical protein